LQISNLIGFVPILRCCPLSLFSREAGGGLFTGTV
jgi:hypothetical protein